MIVVDGIQVSLIEKEDKSVVARVKNSVNFGLHRDCKMKYKSEKERQCK